MSLGDEQVWGPINGKKPREQIAVHPHGRFVAMHFLDEISVWGFTRPTSWPQERAAVWDTSTGKLVWNPGNARLLCWTPAGDEILMVRESYRSNPGGHTGGIIIATPLQSEFNYHLERRLWPAGEVIASTPIKLPTGEPIASACSPAGAITGIVWNDQTEAGLELFSWEDDCLRQLDGRGYFEKRSNAIMGATFSPDGRHVVMAYADEWWWGSDPETPSPGGEFKAGWVIIGDLKTGTYREVDVIVPVKQGWIPAGIEEELLPAPRFLDASTFEIAIPTGELRLFSCSGSAG